jgi:proteasome accessory factor C
MADYRRVQRLHHILAARRHPVSARQLAGELECSVPTVRRTVAHLRELGAPVVANDAAGYRYQRDAAFELPGLWFAPAELEALLVLHDAIVDGAERQFLTRALAPLRDKLESLLSAQGLPRVPLRRRVRILRMGGRDPGPWFTRIADAVVARKRLLIDYRGRERDTESLREVSPQRLVRYRDNWYLDAYCHSRKALRTFAVDRISQASPRARPARDVPEAQLDAHLTHGYGIFAGPATAVAVLRFTAERARWVAEERWHPEQSGAWLADGRFELRLPYADPRELAADALRYGPDVEVVAPTELRALVAVRLRAAAAQYRANPRPARVSG